MNIVKARALTSTVLVVLFTLLLITGTKIYFSQPGRAGGGRGKPMKIHTVLGYSMAATVAVHLYLNFKPLYTELKILLGRTRGQSNNSP